MDESTLDLVESQRVTIQTPKGALCVCVRRQSGVTKRRYWTTWDEDVLVESLEICLNLLILAGLTHVNELFNEVFLLVDQNLKVQLIITFRNDITESQ